MYSTRKKDAIIDPYLVDTDQVRISLRTLVFIFIVVCPSFIATSMLSVMLTDL